MIVVNACCQAILSEFWVPALTFSQGGTQLQLYQELSVKIFSLNAGQCGKLHGRLSFGLIGMSRVSPDALMQGLEEIIVFGWDIAALFRSQFGNRFRQKAHFRVSKLKDVWGLSCV
jgi:hypothetical protein